MSKDEIIEKLKNDEDYYGEFGQQFLSNSNVGTLINNPLALREPMQISQPLVAGRYFHTAILEPEKLDQFEIVDASTRNTKIYKEASGDELLLLQKEVDQLDLAIEAVMSNDVCRKLIEPKKFEYEKPGLTTLHGVEFKGKADILNYTDKYIVDLKTTGNLLDFSRSAWKYNYDSQAYIYRSIFGLDMLYIAVDKNTLQIGVFDCSDEFYERGAEKVAKAVENYKLFYETPDFDAKQYFLTSTL